MQCIEQTIKLSKRATEVSKNDNCHCKLSCGKNHGKERLKRKVLRRPRKTDMEGADVRDMLGQTVSSMDSSNREGPGLVHGVESCKIVLLGALPIHLLTHFCCRNG